jgi:hypothetical protein
VQSPEKDQDQIDQNHKQCIMNGICNDPVDLDPFLKIAVVRRKLTENA